MKTMPTLVCALLVASVALGQIHSTPAQRQEIRLRAWRQHDRIIRQHYPGATHRRQSEPITEFTIHSACQEEPGCMARWRVEVTRRATEPMGVCAADDFGAMCRTTFDWHGMEARVGTDCNYYGPCYTEQMSPERREWTPQP